MGEGSFGAVVLAQSKKTGQLLAIKLIRNIFSDILNCKKVLREIQIMKKLS